MGLELSCQQEAHHLQYECFSKKKQQNVFKYGCLCRCPFVLGTVEESTDEGGQASLQGKHAPGVRGGGKRLDG